MKGDEDRSLAGQVVEGCDARDGVKRRGARGDASRHSYHTTTRRILVVCWRPHLVVTAVGVAQGV